MKYNTIIRKTINSLLFSGIKVNDIKWKPLDIFMSSHLFYCNLFWLHTDVLAEFMWLAQELQVGIKFEDLSILAPCTTICLVATAKIVPLYINRNVLIKSINKLREIHPEINADDEDTTEEFHTDVMNAQKSEAIEKQIAMESTKLLRLVINLLACVSTAVFSVFTLLPAVAMGYDCYVTGKTEMKLPFLVVYFFDINTVTRWLIMYFHQIWSTLIVAINVFAADTLFYVYCVCIQMHFRILCHRYEHMFSWYSLSKKTMKMKFKAAVKRHQELIYLVNQVELLYSKSLLFNIINSSFLICLCSFNMTSLDDAGAVVAFGTFLLNNLSQIFLLCYFGDMLLETSVAVGDAIYKSRWHEMDHSTKRRVLFVITRAQKPCKLTAWKFADLNLSAFTTILSRSWSLFALLKTMYE